MVTEGTRTVPPMLLISPMANRNRASGCLIPVPQGQRSDRGLDSVMFRVTDRQAHVGSQGKPVDRRTERT